ncbi:putative pectinesterase [Lupinus albus]|uniref:Putative pectinesterase n=1 Tax=Lupinus albus TaxID=3870 RepID=A0A6A4P4N4_LUPAL|nr:putative pectinesterase [Lupinus albus]
MENYNFAKPCSPNVITFILFTLLATKPNITSSCTNSITISTNSTQKINENTPIHSNYFRTYIKTSCNSTTYPSICYKYLSPHASKIKANPMKLCNTSLSLALKAAKRASSIVSKILKMTNLTDNAKVVVKDCLDNVQSSMGQLQDSLAAMGQLDGIDKQFQISNMQTWMSSSITNDQTCSDELDEMNLDATIRDEIRKVVLNAAMVNSNALYFVNNLIY